MSEKLTEVEARIVGALIEKQLTTPEYYPLTLNAQVAACNQKSNREPVVGYSEETVQKSLDVLRERNVVYVFYGSINSQLASDETGTGYSDEDTKNLKEALRTLFENDASSARPDGSMEVLKVIWWKHSCPSGDISSAKVHRSLIINPSNGAVNAPELPFSKDEGEGKLKPELIDGF